MLLRRLMTHVKEQNWFAVGLDLFIVVLGIFLGFQVTAWNEDRKEEAAEDAALLRLQAEAERVVAYWQSQVQLQMQHNANRRLLLEVLEAGAMSPDQRDEVDDAILRLMHYPQFNPPRSVYEELIATGALSTISDGEIMRAVGDYAAEFDFASGQLTQFRTNLPTLHAAYKGRIFSVYSPGERSLRRYEYDIAALSEDRDFVSTTVDAVRNQLQFLTIRQGVLNRAIAMCDAVSQAVDMECEPLEIGEEEIRSRDGVNQSRTSGRSPRSPSPV